MKEKDINRLVVLAVKHCPSDHKDWVKVNELAEKLYTPPKVK